MKKTTATVAKNSQLAAPPLLLRSARAKPMNATVTRTFRSGNSIAVRIPREFQVEAGKTLEIKRRGRELVLVEQRQTLAGLVDVLQSLPSDFMTDGRHDSVPQERNVESMFLEPHAPKTAAKKSTKPTKN